LQTIPQNICVVDASTKLDDVEATAEGPPLLSKGGTLSASPTFKDEDEESECQGGPCQVKTHQDSLKRIEAKQGKAMIESNNFRHVGFRNKVTEMILEMLALLPETQRNIFVWRHYRGHPVKEIASAGFELSGSRSHARSHQFDPLSNNSQSHWQRLTA
jgi:Sigma-70, region 4